MSIHKHIDRICLVGAITALLLTFLFANSEALGIRPASRGMGYENRLFDASQVHDIDIVMEAWDRFIETCENEEYAECSVIIDGETYKSVGIRAKGNTSLSTVSSMNSDRYSFKIEFDQYDSAKSYYGLDKLSLNNVIQDTTYMKDYLTYQMMAQFGVAAPKEFCLLREESILGQLDGTIPSTTDGQLSDPSALIDAAHLSLSAMGSMGGGMSGERGVMPALKPTAPGGTDPQLPATPAPDDFPSAAPADDTQPAANADRPPQTAPENMAQISDGQAETSLLIVSLSAAVLMAGLLMAFLFKRR